MSHSSSNGTDGYKPPSFPAVLYLVIVLALGLMSAYAIQWDKPDPNKVVSGFWTAYFAKDYHTVVNDLSVVFLVQTSPEYATKSFNEMIAVRPELEETAQPFIKEMREGGQQPIKPKVKILDKYTQKGTLGALVFFNITDEDKLLGTQCAFLIYEGKDLKVLDFGLADEAALNATTPEDLNKMYTEYEALLQRITTGSLQSEPQVQVQKVE